MKLFDLLLFGRQLGKKKDEWSRKNLCEQTLPSLLVVFTDDVELTKFMP